MEGPQPQSDSPRRTPETLVTVCIVFLAASAAAIAVCVSGAFSSESYRAFAEIENTYRCLMGGELFFVIFLWPLFCGRAKAVSVASLAILLVISVPLVIVAASVSNVPVFMIARTQMLLLAVAAACISACKVIGSRGDSAGRCYYLAASLLAGGLPLFQFILLDLTGQGLRWLSCASPFWAMELAQEPPSDVPRLYWPVALLFFAAVAAALSAAARRRA